MDRRFLGVWVPSEVWLSPRLSLLEKCLLIEIDSLDGPEGCYAGYAYLARFAGVSPDSVKKAVERLISLGYLREAGMRGKLRVLRSNLKSERELVPPEKKEEAKPQKADPSLKTFIDLFHSLYRKKAHELSGRDVKPQWGGKETMLLKGDIETYGADELKRCIYLFFGDQVPEVADFCRHKIKAGYGYGVLHGQLPKLALSTVKARYPCPGCGRWSGHAVGCEVYREFLEKKKQEKEEIERAREEAPHDLDIMGMFRKNIRRVREEETRSQPAGDS